MKISPYLNFNGNCAEAIAFYQKVFGAKAEVLRFGAMPKMEGFELPPGAENLVANASLTFGENTGKVTIMMSDIFPGMNFNFGGTVQIALTLESADQVEACFKALRDGGNVYMELQKTFWSDLFGKVEDKFGVTWMITL